MCCDAEWKREEVPDHKFDFINIQEFHRTDIFTRIKYVFVYIFLLKSFAVYGLDIFTAVTMLSTNHWTNAIYSKCGNDCVIKISFDIAKWIFVGCIIFSFLLLGYEGYKARKVVLSRDISYAFTNIMANDYLSLKNYDNFCLFCHINSSTKKTDDFAFFIFFQFKDWKRLLLADGPRQSINALTLYSFAYANGFQTSNIPAYWDNSPITAMLLFSMILTVLIFAGSLILLMAAAVGYVPLLCYIQGNLKEYVCHKVDKRISELIKKKQRQRIQRNQALEKKLAANGQLTNKKGEVISGSDIVQPTLPVLRMDYDDRKLSPREKRRSDGIYPSPPPAGTVFDSRPQYPQYPPRHEYRQQLSYESNYDDYGSSTNLAAHAAPLGMSYPPVAIPPPMPHAPVASYTSSNFSNPAYNAQEYAPDPSTTYQGYYGARQGYEAGYRDPTPIQSTGYPQNRTDCGRSSPNAYPGNMDMPIPSLNSSLSVPQQNHRDTASDRSSVGLAYDQEDEDDVPSPAYHEVVRPVSPGWQAGSSGSAGRGEKGQWGYR